MGQCIAMRVRDMLGVPCCLAVVFFALYVLCGMFVTYPLDSGTYNFYFDADQCRAYGDMFLTDANHYRVKVHPLFLMISQPVVHAVNGIVGYGPLSALLVESALGAACVAMLYGILEDFGIGNRVAVLFSVFYGLTFSTMFFSSVTETFIFAAFALISFWRFVASRMMSSSKLNRGDYAMLVLFGVLAFGITLTNIIAYIFGLIALFTNREGARRSAAIIICLISFLTVLIILLCFWQKFAWRNAPLFWESMLTGLSTGEYEELKYLSVGRSPAVFLSEFVSQAFVYPLVGAGGKIVHVENSASSADYLVFGELSLCGIAVLVFLAVAVILCLVGRHVRGEGAPRKKGVNRCLLAMACSYVFNLALHVLYAPHAAFLYSPHYLFYAVILFCSVTNSLSSRKMRKVVCLLVAVCALLMLVNNFTVIVGAADYAMQTFGKYYSKKRAVIVALAMLAVALSTLSYLHCKMKRYDVSSGRAAKTVAVAYCALSALSTMFLAIDGVL